MRKRCAVLGVSLHAVLAARAARWDAGTPLLDILRAVATDASRMLGRQDRVGAIEPGEFADLVAVAGNQSPTLRNWSARSVTKDGEVVRDDLAPHY